MYTLITLNISQLQTFIYLLATAHPRTTIQLTRTYNTAYSTYLYMYVTNIPHSVLTGDVNGHSTLWNSYTDDHKGQQIADVISNSYNITLNTNIPTKVPNTTLQQTASPRYLTHCITGHSVQLNTHYHQTTYPSSPQLTYDMTTDHNKTDGLSPTIRKLRPPYPSTYTQQHTKGKDAQKLQDFTRPHSMKKHTNKQHKVSKHL